MQVSDLGKVDPRVTTLPTRYLYTGFTDPQRPLDRSRVIGPAPGVCSNYAELRSELVIADAQRLSEGDVARVLQPFRISSQVHGCWADASELKLP